MIHYSCTLIPKKPILLRSWNHHFMLYDPGSVMDATRAAHASRTRGARASAIGIRRWETFSGPLNFAER